MSRTLHAHDKQTLIESGPHTCYASRVLDLLFEITSTQEGMTRDAIFVLTEAVTRAAVLTQDDLKP